MTYYYKKRVKVGLLKSEVANLLGIDYKRYESIEKGEVRMPNNLIDKFNEVINRNKAQNKIERLTRQDIVDKWWNEILLDNDILKEKMKQFNISTYMQLGNLLGYKNGSTISSRVHNLVPTTYDFRNKLYSFFENELNIQPPKKEGNVHTQLTSEDKDVLNWYKNFDFIGWMHNNDLCVGTINKEIGMPKSTIYYIVNKDHSSPRIKNLKKMKDYVDNYSAKEEPIEVGETETLTLEDFVKQESIERHVEPKHNHTKEEIIAKYKDKLTELIKQEKTTLDSIEYLKNQLYTINTQKQIYQDFINEINEV